MNGQKTNTTKQFSHDCDLSAKIKKALRYGMPFKKYIKRII